VSGGGDGGLRWRLALLGLAAAFPFAAATFGAQRRGIDILVLVLLGLSMTVTTGWLRTIALHAPASLSAGALATSAVLGRGQSRTLALLTALGAGAAVALVPAALTRLRHRDLLPLASLAVTLAVWGVVLPSLRLTPFVRPVVVGIDLGSDRSLYLFALLLAGLGWLAVEHLAASGVGRRMRALGGDPAFAAGTGVDPATTWFAAFALSGTLAGAAGVVLAVLVQGVPDAGTASPSFALVVLAVALLGGAGSPVGALAGALVLGLAPLAVGTLPDAQALLAAAIVVVVACVPGARGGLVGGSAWAARRTARLTAGVR
jgi:ABC-type branched-subunit amino acid transport system permease subunit